MDTFDKLPPFPEENSFSSFVREPLPRPGCPLCGQIIARDVYRNKYQRYKFPYGLSADAANADHVLLDHNISPPNGYSGYYIEAGDAMHSSCLAAWPHKADFIARWNAALAEEWPGKILLDHGAAGFAYTPEEEWSVSARRLKQREEWLIEREKKSAARTARLALLEIKKDQGRALIIAAGLCAPETVDAYIYEMDVREFKTHLAGSGLSRVDFRPDQDRSPEERSLAALQPILRERVYLD